MEDSCFVLSVEGPNMVWDVVTSVVTSTDHSDLTDSRSEFENQGINGLMDTHKDRSKDTGHYVEQPMSNPGCPTSDSHMEYEDLPELQEVPEEHQTVAAFYQVEVGVSHKKGREEHLPVVPPDTHWLTQLAHIATGPQSPLLHGSPNSSNAPVHVFSTTTSNLHSYARPLPSLSSSLPRPPRGRGRHSRTISENGPTVSNLFEKEDMGWRHSWPPTAWHCFLKGTLLRWHRGVHVAWQAAEELGPGHYDPGDEEGQQALKRYGSEGLRLLKHAEVVSRGQSVLQLTFDPEACGHTPLSALCQLDHPFYVQNKGWSSFYPSLTVMHYGIPCYEMEVGDLCLPPGHRDALHTDDSLVLDTFRSYDFTPLDSSAVYVLSSMARQRRTSQSSRGAVSPDRDTHQDAHRNSPSNSSRRKITKSQHDASEPGSNNATPTKCKRPMNAFMLFAKRFRVEYTQMYPGKDNRAISVLLGERWKEMAGEERRAYTLQAKALAERQKKLNPDCWKRKRSNSGCQGN